MHIIISWVQAYMCIFIYVYTVNNRKYYSILLFFVTYLCIQYVLCVQHEGDHKFLILLCKQNKLPWSLKHNIVFKKVIVLAQASHPHHAASYYSCCIVDNTSPKEEPCPISITVLLATSLYWFVHSTQLCQSMKLCQVLKQEYVH